MDNMATVNNIRSRTIINLTTITLQPSIMKPQTQPLTKTAQSDLKKILSATTLHTFKTRLAHEPPSEAPKQKSLLDIKTPSTTTTESTLRRRGNAIAKSLRPQSRSKGKDKEKGGRPVIFSRPSLNLENFTVTRGKVENQEERGLGAGGVDGDGVGGVKRKVLIDRAVYYGNVQLPYLHSSDAISCLYQKPKNPQNPQPLLNPPPSISPSHLTSLKSLHLYYTQIDSLRQLGTGWSTLKTLSIACSPLTDLSGLSIFPSLQNLFTPFNNLHQISDLMYHPSLRCLDLMDNKIDAIEQIQYIYTIGALEWVELRGNPVMGVKERARLVGEALGARLQVQEWNRDVEGEIVERGLDYQVRAYEGIQVSNGLIRDINEQILGDQIKVGQLWRAAQNKINNPQSQRAEETADIEIIQSFVQSDDEEEQSFEQFSSNGLEKEKDKEKDKDRNKLKLRVTPLIEYVEPVINVAALKKYFYNKVCPQAEGNGGAGKARVERNGEDRSEREERAGDRVQEKEAVPEERVRRFAATQKLTSTGLPAASASEQKKRLTSISLKKKLGKLSLSKNITTNLNLASTASSVLTNLKTKEEFNDINCMTSTSGLKFVTKRRLISKLSEEKPL